VSRLVSSSSPPIPEQLLETLAASIPAMAEPNPQVEREVEVEEVRRPKLRYLEFVQVAAAQATICLAGLYALAKDHAGPLRPGVDAVESAVKGVVGPVYGRFHGVPLDVLAFVDRKVAPAPSFAVANGCRLGVVPRDERAVARLARSLAGRGGRACGGAR
jgi:hypothetical protein